MYDGILPQTGASEKTWRNDDKSKAPSRKPDGAETLEKEDEGCEKIEQNDELSGLDRLENPDNNRTEYHIDPKLY